MKYRKADFNIIDTAPCKTNVISIIYTIRFLSLVVQAIITITSILNCLLHFYICRVIYNNCSVTCRKVKHTTAKKILYWTRGSQSIYSSKNTGHITSIWAHIFVPCIIFNEDILRKYV